MDRVWQWIAALGGAAVSFVLGMPPIIWVLVAVMTLDYVTGLICGALCVSNKTDTGAISSRAAFKGLMKKVLILLVVALAALIDCAVTASAGIEFSAVTGATALWFVASEGVSVIENAAAIGVPIPGVIRQALDVLKSKGGEHPPDDVD